MRVCTKNDRAGTVQAHDRRHDQQHRQQHRQQQHGESELDDTPHDEILARRQQRAEFVGRQPAERRAPGHRLDDVAPIEHRHAGDRGVRQGGEPPLAEIGAEIGDDGVDAHVAVLHLVEIEPSAGRKNRHVGDGRARHHRVVADQVARAKLRDARHPQQGQDARTEELDARIVDAQQQQEGGDQGVGENGDRRHVADVALQGGARKGVEPAAAVPHHRIAQRRGDDGELRAAELAGERLTGGIDRNRHHDAEQEADDGVDPRLDEALRRRPHRPRAIQRTFDRRGLRSDRDRSAHANALPRPCHADLRGASSGQSPALPHHAITCFDEYAPKHTVCTRNEYS